MTTILVTGAGRGIGLEFARQYAAAKAEVIACCRNPAKAGELKAQGVKVMELDVGSPESAARLAVALKSKPIDILINNAGVYGPKNQSAIESDYEGFLETFRINSVGPLMVSQALRVNLLAGHDKKLAVLTSKMGSISDSSGGVLAYRASKAALNMIMDGVAKSWARDGVAVAILHPGWVKTDMGGPGAAIGVEESVRGLRSRIAELSLANSGRFLDYKGAEIGW
jgi:NAD(P)-dependent dehydrogenase (short-subunit alcohol dehydrogenase family)